MIASAIRPRAIDFSFRVRVTALKITTNGRVIFEGLFLKGYDRMSKIPIPTVLHNKILYALFEIYFRNLTPQNDLLVSTNSTFPKGNTAKSIKIFRLRRETFC